MPPAVRVAPAVPSVMRNHPQSCSWAPWRPGASRALRRYPRHRGQDRESAHYGSRETLSGGGDALVGGGEGDPHVLATGLAVEAARRREYAARGQPGDGRPGVLPRSPRGTGRRRSGRRGSPNPRRARRSGAPARRTEPSGRRRGRRPRGRRSGPAAPATARSSRRACGPRAAAGPAPRHPPRTRPGSRRGWTACSTSRRRAGPRGCRRRPAGRGCSASWAARRRVARSPPVELGVALVAGHDHAVLARPGDHLGEVLDAEHSPVGLLGLLSHNSFGVVAGVSGPSAARPSTTWGRAPASRAPTS